MGGTEVPPGWVPLSSSDAEFFKRYRVEKSDRTVRHVTDTDVHIDMDQFKFQILVCCIRLEHHLNLRLLLRSPEHQPGMSKALNRKWSIFH